MLWFKIWFVYGVVIFVCFKLSFVFLSVVCVDNILVLVVVNCGLWSIKLFVCLFLFKCF